MCYWHYINIKIASILFKIHRIWFNWYHEIWKSYLLMNANPFKFKNVTLLQNPHLNIFYGYAKCLCLLKNRIHIVFIWIYPWVSIPERISQKKMLFSCHAIVDECKCEQFVVCSSVFLWSLFLLCIFSVNFDAFIYFIFPILCPWWPNNNNVSFLYWTKIINLSFLFVCLTCSVIDSKVNVLLLTIAAFLLVFSQISG